MVLRCGLDITCMSAKGVPVETEDSFSDRSVLITSIHATRAALLQEDITNTHEHNADLIDLLFSDQYTMNYLSALGCASHKASQFKTFRSANLA